MGPHAAVITLQHSLLPALPEIDGWLLAARYLVGVDGDQVGGDWYGVLLLAGLLRQRGPPCAARPHPDGELQRLDEQRSPMIGAVRDLGRRTGAGHTEAEVLCTPGSQLLLNTDGFPDVAGEADERTDLLERTMAGLPVGASAEEVVERVVAVCLPGAPRRRRAAGRRHRQAADRRRRPLTDC